MTTEKTPNLNENGATKKTCCHLPSAQGLHQSGKLRPILTDIAVVAPLETLYYALPDLVRSRGCRAVLKTALAAGQLAYTYHTSTDEVKGTVKGLLAFARGKNNSEGPGWVKTADLPDLSRDEWRAGTEGGFDFSRTVNGLSAAPVGAVSVTDPDGKVNGREPADPAVTDGTDKSGGAETADAKTDRVGTDGSACEHGAGEAGTLDSQWVKYRDDPEHLIPAALQILLEKLQGKFGLSPKVTRWTLLGTLFGGLGLLAIGQDACLYRLAKRAQAKGRKHAFIKQGLALGAASALGTVSLRCDD